MRHFLENVRQDIRYGARRLLKQPGFTLIALLTLALGIGANTAIFSIVNRVLLRPLPYQATDRLVVIKEVIERVGPEPGPIPAPDVLTFQQETQSLEDVGGYFDTEMDLTAASQPVRISAVRITWNTFSMLGVAPLLGRTFSEEDDHPDSYLAVLSYSCWQERFGGAADVTRQTVELDRKPYRIIGVMPQGFMVPLETTSSTPPELWVPMGFTVREKAAVASLFAYGAIARLKPGVSLAQAQADVSSVMLHIRETYPSEIRNDLQTRAVVIPLSEDAYRDVRAPLYMLVSAVGFVLLIAVANVANLMLARGSSRQKELALRRALGASGRRLLAQLLTESVLLATAGGALGVALAAWSTRLLAAIAPANLPRLNGATLDWRMLLFALIVSVISGLLSGSAPAFFALRTDLNRDLKEGGRSGSLGRPHQRLQSVFVITQVALAFILLIGSGLLIRSFQRVLTVESGFRPERVTTGSIFLSNSAYPRAEQVQNFFTELLARLQQIPGASAVAVSTDTPLKGGWTRLITAEGYEPPPGAALNPGFYTVIAGDYFQAMGIPLIKGRFFTAQDSINGSRPVIVSESLARKYFAGGDAIGKRLKYGTRQQQAVWREIIGVVGDVKQTTLEENILPHVYAPMMAAEIPLLQRIGGVSVTLSARASRDSAAIAPALQSAVWSLDRQLPVTDLMTMEQVVSRATSARRFTLTLVFAFAAAALLLAAVGLYGVIAYAVTQRTQEIGIRIALGATTGAVLRLVIKRGMTPALLGLMLGLTGALALTRLVKSLLFGVSPTDPLTFLAVAVLLAGVALLACYLPARRAAKVDPMIALRHE
jgi:predicted permease